MRLVIDTSILISYLLNRNGVVGEIVQEALEKHTLLISHALLSEIRDVLQREKFARFFTAEMANELLFNVSMVGVWITPSQKLYVCCDPNDNHVLELAVAGNAEIILTGDKDLLALHPFENISILSPRQLQEQTS